MKKAPFPEWKRAFSPENQGGVRSLKTMADFSFMAFNANGSDGNRKAVLITLLRRRSTVLKPNRFFGSGSNAWDP